MEPGSFSQFSRLCLFPEFGSTWPADSFLKDKKFSAPVILVQWIPNLFYFQTLAMGMCLGH